MQNNLNIGFENFRVFKDVVNFDFAPITILTGANNSGKSTIIKGIKIMEQFLNQQKIHYGYRSFNIWNIPLLEFNTNELKILGSFMNVVNDPNKDYISFSLKSTHEYFGEYHIIFRFIKNNDNRGRLQNLLFFIENSEKPIIDFKYDNDTRKWGYKADYLWLAENLKNFFLILEKSENLAKIYSPLIEEFHDKNYSVDFIPHSFIPKVSKEFVCFLAENGFDINEYISIRKKISFLHETEFIKSKHIKNHLINESLEVKNYYDFWINQKFKLTDLIFVDYILHPVISSLEENFTVYDLCSKLVEIYPHLSDKKDLLELCELAFTILFNFYTQLKARFSTEKGEIEIINPILSTSKLPRKVFKIIDQIILFNASRLYLPIEQHIDKIERIEIPHILFNEHKDEIDYGLVSILNILFDRLPYEGVWDNLEQLEEFTKLLIAELLKNTQNNFRNIEIIEANRATEKKRTYDFHSNNSPFAKFLHNFYFNETHYRGIISISRQEKIDFVNHWLKEFEIADKMEIEINDEGDGAKVFLTKDNVKRNFSDLGYGTTKLLPLFMYVADFSIKNGARIGNKSQRREVAGSGVWDGWDEPIIFPYTICIEEPETNLHPMIQSKLADFFVFCAKKLNIRFIIETHSEYLIRKLQYLTAKQEITTKDTVIHYIGHPDRNKRAHGEEQIRTIHIKPNGQLTKPFGSGFLDEADKLALSLLDYALN